MLALFRNVRERTLRVASCIPPEQMDWSCAQGKFTLGDLLRHIAVTERYMFAECVQGKPSRYTTQGKELGLTCDEVFALMERLHKESMDIFRGAE